MTLEEAIKHCEEKTEELERRAEEIAMSDAEGVYQPQVGRCRECANEHRQLAEWLRELREYKEERVGCEFCKHQDKLEKERPCSLCKHNFMDMFEREVKADDE